MNLDNLFNHFEEIKDDLKFIAASKVRVKILISLSQGPKKLSEIKKETLLSSSTILHGMNSLEQKKLVSKGMEGYFLTQLGKITALKFIKLIKNLYVLKNHERLWLNHDISGIPDYLLMDVGCFCNSILIESTTTDVTKPRSIYSKLLMESKNIKGVAPVIYPYFLGLFKERLGDDINIQFIMNTEVLNRLTDVLGREYLKRTISRSKLTLWKIPGNLRVVFTVTNKYMFIGLFSVEGVFDLTKILISEDEEAITWGNRLFDYYLEQAVEVKL